MWGGSRENMTEDRKKKWRTGYQAVPVAACLICLVCLAGGLLFLCGKAEEENRKHALEPMPGILDDASTDSAAEQFLNAGSGAAAEILAGGLQGSGVIWGGTTEGVLILTAAHVLEEAEDPVRVIFGNGSEAAAEDIQIYEDIDLAILLVPWEDIPENQEKRLYRVRIDKERFDALQAEDICLAAGFRAGRLEGYMGKVLAPWIFMEEYGQYMLWAEVEIKPGMSGGGLFDAQGNFLGILSGGSGDDEAAVVPLSVIMSVLQFSY